MNNLKYLIRQYQATNKRADGTEYTQEDIADMAGVNVTTLSRYANNQIGSVNWEIWQKLAEFFNVEGSEIFDVRRD